MAQFNLPAHLFISFNDKKETRRPLKITDNNSTVSWAYIYSISPVQDFDKNLITKSITKDNIKKYQDK